MKRVYVAGAYSSDNVLGVLTNMQKGMRLSTEVFLAGYAPFCPWLDHHYTFMLREGESITLQQYYDYSMAWLESSAAVILVPGWENSHGTKKELQRAAELNIPVFHSLRDLNAHFMTLNDFYVKEMGL